MIERHVIKYLAPGWFAVVMGTGGLQRKALHG